MRKVIAAFLFAVTGACLLLAGLALSNLFDDYKDSPDSMFIETAATVFAVAVVCLIGDRRRPPQHSWTPVRNGVADRAARLWDRVLWAWRGLLAAALGWSVLAFSGLVVAVIAAWGATEFVARGQRDR